MNPEQLAALLAAGLITLAQHDQALKNREKPKLDLTMEAQRLSAADDGSRLITGTITKYDELIPSHGMILKAGSLTTRQPLKKVKMLRDHDMTQPTGYMTEVDSKVETGTFFVPEGPDGDRALLEAQNGLRDGFSIGFSISDYEFDDDWVLTVLAGEIYEVSQVACPAITDAGVTKVAASLAANRKENTMNRAQLAAALAAGTITQAEHDAGLALIVSIETSTQGKKPATQVDPEVATGPELTTQQKAPIEVHDRELSLRDVTAKLSAAFNTGNPADVRLAINDIIPSDDAGTAFLNRDDWQGELWTASDDTRTWIDAIGTPSQLTNLKAKGWKWTTKPSPAEYAGDKAEVPSGDAITASTEFTAFRVAGGWDVDRAYVDFADEEYLNAFWAAATSEYKKNSNTSIRTRVVNAASAGANVTAGGALALVKTIINDGRAIGGGKINRVFLGDAMWDDFSNTPSDNLPIWLKDALVGVDVQEGTSDVGTLHIVNDSNLTTNQAVGFDSRALTVKEKTPLNLQALDIAHAGIDLGFYSYLMLQITDPRLLKKRLYVAA